ncbi:MAG: T9SS type A sorting domain-containing protein, partial [Cyclobacteriaceae bacterium]
GAAQTVQALGYNNLRISGSGTKTLAANTTVGGNLEVSDGVTFNIGAFDFTTTGTTTVGGGTSGILSITSATGVKTFVGLVTINNGATWTNTNEGVTFRGGITNNGTFTSGTGVQLFNTSSQTLTGTFTITNLTVNGAAVVLTNTNTLTVGNALSGTGRITQGAGATLNIGGTSGIANMTASASGNTVNYTGAAQTVHNNAYENLGLSGSGVKTLQSGTILIAGDLTLSGSASATGVTNLTIGNDINIGSGTTFTSGAFDHIIGGNWINDGTFNHSSRRITFSGTTTQSIQGTSVTTFYDLRIAEGPANPDVQLNSTAGVNLVGEMTFDDDATFDADGPGGTMVFTVISTSGGDGRIGILGGTADVTGNVTVQRYMDAEGKIYRYISTPVDNPTAQDLQGEIPITGPFTGSSFPPQTGCTGCAPCTGCVLNNTSMYQYDETIVDPSVNNRYIPFPSSGGTNSETMIPGRGYAVYVRNDVSPTTWNLRAPLNKGEVDLNPSITGANDGFNLVGNPYASPIDWEAGAWTRSGIDATIYIWDNSISNYASYTLGGASTNGGSRYIATGQAFWVDASGSPDLRAQEGIKADQASVLQATFFRTAKPVDHLRLKLVSDKSSDEVLVRLNHEGATADYDLRMDAHEFPSDTVISLYSVTADKKRLAVNTFGIQSEKSTEIKLGIAGVKQGSYTINFQEFENFSAQTNVYLLDRFTNTLEEILPDKKQYSFAVTSDPASFGDKRFVVYLTRDGKKPVMTEVFESTITVYPNPTSDIISVRVKSTEDVSAELINTLGVPVMNRVELEKAGDERRGQFDLSSLEAGIYIIQIQRGGIKYNQRILKK